MNLHEAEPFYETNYGRAYCGDALDLIKKISSNSINLIMTSPPFALTTKKSYDNVDHTEYIEWFTPFAKEFYRVLKEDGSLILHLGGSWIKSKPVKSLYNYKLLINCVKN